MPVAWRLVKATYAKNAFDGHGARITGGRWNSAGVRMVYLGDTPATTALEILVQDFPARMLRQNWVIFRGEFRDAVVEYVDPAMLPKDWSATPGSHIVRAIGDRWVACRSSLVLQVPSAVLPLQFNFLINPEHPAFPSALTISSPEPFRFDPRLLKKLR
jgi:RES domain-containing protein